MVNIPKTYIAQFLPKNPVIVEAGAHIGRDTKKMARLWPNSTIHAFEPIPELFISLQKKTAGLPNVHRYNCALSNKTGTALMYESGGRSTAVSSLLTPIAEQFVQPEAITTFTAIEVKTITLDDWARQHNINAVDFLWLDMQGYELAALQAAPELLKTVRVIHAEANRIPRYQGMPLYAELSAWLLEQGFIVQYELFARPEWGNALFVRKD